MSMALRAAVKNFTDEYLLEQYCHKRQEYTAEAQGILEEEIRHRGISQQRIEELSRNDSTIQFSPEDFVRFTHTFSQTDILLARAILQEKQIPFLIDSQQTSDIIPTETMAERVFTIHVHKDAVEEAHRVLENHFVQGEGVYSQRPLSAADQLRALSFHEIHLSDTMVDMTVDVEFSSRERDTILALARKLDKERDAVEQRLERPVFYYENVQEVIERLQGKKTLVVNDLMTILEILQIYCDQPDFPDFMNETIIALMDFLHDLTEK